MKESHIQNILSQIKEYLRIKASQGIKDVCFKVNIFQGGLTNITEEETKKKVYKPKDLKP